MRVLIAEDQAVVRERLAQLLTDTGCRVVSQHADGESAVEFLRAHPDQVDVLFLDIQMAGISGLDVVSLTGVHPVVFVTGYAQHALKAFEVAAVDYVLKPLTPTKVRNAVNRLRKRFPSMDPGRSLVRIRVDRKETGLPIHRVEAWEVHDREVEVHADGGQVFPSVAFRSLPEIEENWPGEFARVSRNRLERAQG